jgi:hypothetical protein
LVMALLPAEPWAGGWLHMIWDRSPG